MAIKVQLEGKSLEFNVESLDADLLNLTSLEEFWQKTYHEGVLECLLHDKELECECKFSGKSY